MGAPAIPTYKQAFGSLSNEYDPQTKLINSQIAQLAPQQAAEQASLDQAKVNAFSDINRSSNARGVMFSGVPVDEQAQYVGTKYLPAVANLKSTFQGNRNTLLGQINALNAQRVQEAKGNISAAQQNYNNYIKAQADAQYKQAELALRAQSNAISASRARSGGSSGGSGGSSGDWETVYSDLKNTKGSNGMVSIGKDGYANPTSYNTILSAFVAQGGSAAAFKSHFGYLRNPDQKNHPKWEQYK